MDDLRRRARELRNAATEAENHLWQRLRLKQLAGFKFRRQVPIAGYIADFLCPEAKLIIELDGGQHYDQIAYDERRTGVLQANGYHVLRYWNNDALVQTEAVLEDILGALISISSDGKSQSQSQSQSQSNGTPPQPSPALRAREGDNSKGNKT
ncbi:endonuclease domain-containing protein [Pseudoxanthomonas sp. UTMC 1351]|uniref:endonuclease domain-containing protein n=1 Tax=Pseudoxanthomonas sp. UTMC 1351 TaxID=2695853 RepID=UPI0034CE02CA